MIFDSLDKAVCTFLEESSKIDKGEHHNDWWWGSELGMCKRKQCLRRLDLPASNTKETRIMLIGKQGSLLHEWIEEVFGKLGMLVENEGKIVNESLRYRGRFDAIVKLKNGLSLIDIKSQRSEAFFKRKQRPEGQRVEEFQKLQLASYVLFARNKYPDLEEARIYYVDRGGGVTDEYAFRFKNSTFERVINELNELNMYWSSNKLPPVTTVKWECRYCPWSKVCKTFNKLSLTQIKEQYGRQT